MGIPHLNRFLLNNCSGQSIGKKHLSSFTGKTIVIDTSIYLYKFIGCNALMENMYSMITTFKYYGITPIFIFDGKPPEEKKDVLKQRYMDKQAAEAKYNELKLKLETVAPDEKTEIAVELDKLRMRFIRIKREDIDQVKLLMESCGVQYYDAAGEADHMCAKMVINKQAWACMSDDMDMFVYGCTRVMRHISLLNHTVIFYNTNGILRELQIHMKHFREIMILSGTDYNVNGPTNDVNKTMKQFRQFKLDEPNDDRLFRDWLKERPDYKFDYDTLCRVYDMFHITDKSEIKTHVCSPNIDKMKTILKPYGFVFV
jgi:hypothetical protein